MWYEGLPLAFLFSGQRLGVTAFDVALDRVNTLLGPFWKFGLLICRIRRSWNHPQRSGNGVAVYPPPRRNNRTLIRGDCGRVIAIVESAAHEREKDDNECQPNRQTVDDPVSGKTHKDKGKVYRLEQHH
jgi:hypothetical protein